MHKLAAFALTALFLACNQSNFAGQSPRQADASPTPATTITPPPTSTATGTSPQPSQQTLTLTCSQLTGTTPATLSVKAPSAGQSVEVQVRGQICPQSAETLTVLFIIDWSGSMSQSDPTFGGTCGRAQAAQTILSYLQSNAGPNVQIQAGLVPFSDSVVTSSVLPLTPLAQFAPAISAQSFCQADGGTNYVAAFEAAQQLLANVPGRKVVYFMSDGAPNYDAQGNYAGTDDPPPGSPAVNDSIAAGQALVASGVTLDALLLGQDGQQSQAIMTAVAGSANNVRLAASASQLTSQILQFAPVTLSSTGAQATLAAPGAGATPVSLASFQQDPSTPGVWDFLTAPLTLRGQPGQTVPNTLTVTAGGASGAAPQQVQVIVDYTVP